LALIEDKFAREFQFGSGI